MATGRTILLSAAEVSGDVFGAVLARELRANDPTLRLAGLGGRLMAEAGVDLVDDITDTSVVGYVDGLAHIGRYLGARRRFSRRLVAQPVAAVIAIDAPGWNLPLLRSARRRGIHTVYYICPQTWLWNAAGAVRRLAETADTVVAVLPEEARAYREAGFRTIYRGHPVVDVVAGPNAGHPAREAGHESATHVGILPGSRAHEIERLLPPMTAAVRLMTASLGPITVNLGVAPSGGAGLGDRTRRLFAQAGGTATGAGIVVRETTSREALRRSDVSLAASGSVLLEACLLDAPVVMAYRIDALTYWIGDRLLRIPERLPHFALPNLIAGERIIPELIQGNATPERLASSATALVTRGTGPPPDAGWLRTVRQRLGVPGVTRAIAAEILDAI